MSYQISSTRFDNPDIAELLKVLAIYFQGQGIEFYIVGAAARDIILGLIYDRKSHRKTNDLDIAIMIKDWNVFDSISRDLCELPDFSRSLRQKQKFHYKSNLILDIIPFGEIARSDKNIYWPPDETHIMSVSGFVEMAKKALTVTIDDRFLLGVASLPGIFILKLAAWKDRNKSTNKDAEDIAYIIDEYLEINLDRALDEHGDIYLRDDFTTFKAGAILMGRDTKILLIENSGMLNEFAKIIADEISLKENSVLINQILETHRLKGYQEIYTALTLIHSEMQN